MVLVPFPFYKGMTERVDSRMFPEPGLKKIENGRMRKDGRIGKKYGNADFSTTMFPSNSSGKFPGALAEHAGQRLVVARDLVNCQYSTGSSWRTIGKVSRWLPERMFAVGRGETNTLTQPTCAISNGKVLYAYGDGVTVYGTFATTAGVVIDQSVQLAVGTSPRAVSVGTTTVCFLYRSGTSISQTRYDTSGAAPSWVATTAVGTLASSSDFYEAAPYSSTQYVLAYYSAANTITVKLITASTGAASATGTVTTVGAPSAISVYGTEAENIYVSWVESTGAVRVAALNTSLVLTGGPTTVETVTGAVDHQPNMVRLSSSSVLLVYNVYTTSSGGYGRVSYATISSTATAGTIRSLYNCRAATKPFDAFDGKWASFWVHTDNSGPSNTNAQWNANRGYFLVTVRITDLNSYSLEMSGSPLQASDFIDNRRLPEVVSDTSGYYTCLSNVLRSATFGVSTSELNGIDALTFSSNTLSLRSAYRSFAKAGTAIYFAGGVVSDCYGIGAREAGFAHAPAINSLTASAGGSLSAGSYSYKVIYEYLDTAGRRWRSAASVARSVTAALNDKVDLTIASLALHGKWIDRYSDRATAVPGTIVAHIYRTKAGGSAYYRTTPNSGAPVAADISGPVVTYTDSRADADLTSEFLYTDGGVLDNVLPPACRYITFARNRLVLGGLLEANKVIVSKLLVSGEPAQFVDNDSFSIFVPEDVTAVAGLDDAIVIFSEDSIFMVYGEGPNDQGIGAYSLPRRLPSNVGCIDHRSVVETPDGLMFQSKHGIYLLPRGFGPPVFIGADIQDSLATYPIIQSATLCRQQGSGSSALPEATVRFIVADAETPAATRILVYDLKSRVWSVDDNDVAMGIGGSWDDKFVFARSDCTQTAPLRSESYTAWGNAGDFSYTKLFTCDIQPFGFCGWGRVHSVVVFGEQRSDANLVIQPTIDGSSQSPENYSITESVGKAFRREYILPTDIMTAISFEITDSPGVTTPSEGLVFHGIYLDVEPEEGLVRLPDTSRG